MKKEEEIDDGRVFAFISSLLTSTKYEQAGAVRAILFTTSLVGALGALILGCSTSPGAGTEAFSRARDDDAVIGESMPKGPGSEFSYSETEGGVRGEAPAEQISASGDSEKDLSGESQSSEGQSQGSADESQGSEADAQDLEGATSDGCGKSTQPGTGAYTMIAANKERAYRIDVPANYDSSQEYRLIFVFHGLGGSAQGTAGSGGYRYQGVWNQMDDDSTIFVAPQGLPTESTLSSSPQPGWPDDNGEDVAFIRALLDELEQAYCVDEERIYATGISYGGIMSNRLGCEMGDKFRAIAPIMGSGPDGWWSGDRFNPTASCAMKYETAYCVGQVAAWITHGSADTIVKYCQGERSRDSWMDRNDCASNGTTNATTGCVEYSCDEGYPVVWCPTNLGHTSPSFSAEEIWGFFVSLEQ
ncbi:MAG: prolyl oligopeptidase family serine peptidase [Polyangiaceae bacterium]|nr:prolyl oligopeptidase family serine peptidase [Polyangiaceae bacterium]